MDEIRELLMQARKSEDEKYIARKCIGLIDLTSLNATDQEKSIIALSSKALEYSGIEGVPSIPAVCVYPVFVRRAKQQLLDSGIQVASVAGAFPHAQSPLEVRKREVEFALESGADEIDMVISRGRFLAGDLDFVYQEISEIKEVCGKHHLKAILETGELQTETNIRKASKIAMDAGADFIKTSTGKVQPAATLETMLIMLEEIREFYKRTSKKIGIKPAGGIRSARQAIDYYLLVKELLGEEWLKPELFRIGASSLAQNLIDFVHEDQA
ncbi:MAG: deoxyribose-phosphate aldolase [Bacteroidales bacterium]|nr:deoxyribose-phosphate aldolase [Bacteroidales bacterium]MCF8388565.1 deoxyribose-phosphate aldolase [Bacteroidales bacterium]MCF8397305.1 deoxyribose-phosphate aldolase [Bacteroidales bacterium]